MRVLVGCETSGRVREAFRALGHAAWSCDILPADDGSPHHIQCDVRELLRGNGKWDLGIFHPPCTRLCNSGVRWLHERDLWADMREGVELYLACLNAPIARVAVENPVMHKYAREIIGRGPDFTIQLWQCGDWETKRMCFHTRNLPALAPIYRTLADARAGLGLPNDAQPPAIVHRASPGPDRWKQRSETRPGLAGLMAAQWGANQIIPTLLEPMVAA